MSFSNIPHIQLGIRQHFLWAFCSPTCKVSCAESVSTLYGPNSWLSQTVGWVLLWVSCGNSNHDKADCFSLLPEVSIISWWAESVCGRGEKTLQLYCVGVLQDRENKVFSQFLYGLYIFWIYQFNWIDLITLTGGDHTVNKYKLLTFNIEYNLQQSK